MGGRNEQCRKKSSDISESGTPTDDITAKSRPTPPRKPKYPIKDDKIHNLHETLLRSVAFPDTRRNRQRDGLDNGGPSTSTVSLPTVESRRPLSTPVQVASRSNHMRNATEPLAERPISEPILWDTNKATNSTAGASTSNRLVDEEPPPYEPTDWDAFLARVSGSPDEATYEDLLLLAEVSGTASTSRNIGSSEEPFNVSVAQVELLSRRTTKEGKAKLKLIMAGLRVDKCGICLTQFREGEKGAFPDCSHCFHEACLQRWVARSASCPVCRVDLRTP